MNTFNGMIIDPRMLAAIQKQQQLQQQTRVAGPPAPVQQTVPQVTAPASTGQPDAPVVDPSISAPVDTQPTPASVDEPSDGWTMEKDADDVIRYKLHDGTHTLEIPAADVPMDVAARALKKYPSPGAVSTGSGQFKIEGTKLRKLVPDKGIWGDVPDDIVGTLPEEVRKLYVDAKSKSDMDFKNQIYTQPMSGNVTANADEIKQQEKQIHGISAAKGTGEQLTGIYSPETLAAAREQAATVLEAAKGGGDKNTIVSATKRVQELKDMHVTASPDGGYTIFKKSPIDGYWEKEDISPKNQKDNGVNDWTQDPAVVTRAGTARAEIENRVDGAAASNNTMLNANAQRLVHDYIGPYAQYYRSQQLAGSPLGHVAPELMVKKLTEEMATNPDAAIKTIAEMQKSLAEIYGKGYMAITPGVHAPTSYNDGKMDKISAIVPAQQGQTWDRKSTLIADPNKKAPRDVKEVPFVLPDIMGQDRNHTEASANVRDNAGVDANRTQATWDRHEDLIYKQKAVPLKGYKVPSKLGGMEQRQDSADKNTAFDQWIQGKLMQEDGKSEFKKKYANAMVTALEQTAGQIKMNAQPKKGQTTTRTDPISGEPIGQSSKENDAMYDEKAKNAAFAAVFGAEKSPYWETRNVNGKTMKVQKEWSEPGVVRKWAGDILTRPKVDFRNKELRYHDTHVDNPSAAAKTLHLIEGVAAGRNGHIEIDTRLKDYAASNILNAMNGVLSSEADDFMRNNAEYFVNNLRTGTGDNVYRVEDVWDAAKATLVSQAVNKQMGMTLQQPK